MSQVQIQLEKVPFYQGAIACVEMGIESSLQVSNVRLRRAVKSQDQVRVHGGPRGATDGGHNDLLNTGANGMCFFLLMLCFSTEIWMK